MITQELLKKLFRYDKSNGGLIWKKRTCVMPKSRGKSFGFVEDDNGKPRYVKGQINQKTYREHRLVWIWHYGEIPDNLKIDHINRIKYDNRIQNLRIATHSDNMRNRYDNWFNNNEIIELLKKVPKKQIQKSI